MSFVVENARVFDGKRVIDADRIAVENGVITSSVEGGTVIDGTGCTLLPGLIDSHAHLYEDTSYLDMCARAGVTTMLDMGNRNNELTDARRNIPGKASAFSVQGIAFAPGSNMWERMAYPEEGVIRSTKYAAEFVEKQVERGADFIKMILENPALDEPLFPFEIGKALVDAAHSKGKLVVAHAVDPTGFDLAIEIGVDEISHIPMAPLPPETVQKAADKGIAVVPTVVMMDAIADNLTAQLGQEISSALCKVNLTSLHETGVKVFVGTDANLNDDLTPANVTYGTSMHQELEIFVGCGFSPVEALTAATSGPAEFFGLGDRGLITEGKRADLVLVKGDPTANISDIRNVERVWIAGEEVSL